MIREPWKRRLINLTHTSMGARHPLRSRLELPKTVLGRKLRPNQTMNNLFPWLQKVKGEIRRDELMRFHTSIRIGGPADLFILPKDLFDLQTILKNKGKTPLFVLGEGTNLLVPDEGIRGIVISLKECFKTISPPVFFENSDKKDKALIWAGAGVKLSFLAKYAAKYGLTGLEGLVGIPGSLGGAVIMNAGAEGTEIEQVIHQVKLVTPEGELQTLNRQEIQFQYRKSTFPVEGGIVVEVELELKKGNPSEIHRVMSDHLSRRSGRQPLTVPNSGSIFKNPPGDTAGRLIEAAGLKGFSIGQAAVSLKHANFIVNKGEATAEDVLNLIQHIQTTVKERTGITLEPEIVIAGETTFPL